MTTKTHFMNKIFLAFALIILSCFTLQAQTINTLAGLGIGGYTGDGGPATGAELNQPYSLAFAPTGDLFFSDAKNNCIRKIDHSGIVSTVAGTGIAGYTGDGGPAVSAELSLPLAIAFDSVGDLYICDCNNHCIRLIDTSGIIHTVVGTGVSGYGGDGGLASSAQLATPTGITFDNKGNLLIVDLMNSNARKVNTLGLISTIVGSNTNPGDGGPAINGGLVRPEGVAVDRYNNIYIADESHLRVRKIDTFGIIHTIAGGDVGGYAGDGGPATAALLAGPDEIVIDSVGNVLFTDKGNNCVRKIDTSGIITTIVGTGTPGFSGDGGNPASAELRSPAGMAMDNAGRLYIADNLNHRIRIVDFTTGIEQLNISANELTLFPNANNGSFTLSGPLLTKSPTVQITISDLTGRIVLNDEAHIQNGHINKQVKLSSTTPAGNYLLTLTTDQGTTTLKFEKK
jgi:sugar lactone lactonase YvrE